MKIKSSLHIKTIAGLIAFGTLATPEVEAQNLLDYFLRRVTPVDSQPGNKSVAASKFDLKRDVAHLDRISGELSTSFQNDIQNRDNAHQGGGHSGYGHGKGHGRARHNPKRQFLAQHINDYCAKVDALSTATNHSYGPDVALIKKSLPSICEHLAIIDKTHHEVRTSEHTNALIKRNTVLASRVNKEAAHLKVRPIIKQDALTLDRVSTKLLESYRSDIQTFRPQGSTYHGQSHHAQGHGKGAHGKGPGKRQIFLKQIVDYNAQVDHLIAATSYSYSTKHPAIKKAMHGICASLEAIGKYQHEVKTTAHTLALIKRNQEVATQINNVTTKY